ncbi:hypothetical protein V8F33_000399 [Rhypophila sp. PSN 637]
MVDNHHVSKRPIRPTRIRQSLTALFVGYHHFLPFPWFYPRVIVSRYISHLCGTTWSTELMIRLYPLSLFGNAAMLQRRRGKHEASKKSQATVTT